VTTSADTDRVPTPRALDRVLRAFPAVAPFRDHRGRTSYTAACPSHDAEDCLEDILTIAEGADGGVQLRCQAGCSADRVAGAVGLSLRDLAPRPGEARTQSSETSADEQPAQAPLLSDDALALMFTEAHRGTLRFTAELGHWHQWTGARWERDITLHVYDRIRQVCRAAVADCTKERVAGQVASAKTVAAVERLARADRAHAATVAEWDAHEWLLNTPGGVLDLRTGDLQPARPDLYLTKCTAVTPGGDAPTWRRFVDWATGGDTDLADFLQRVAGYALTGSTREHALFFLHGTGGNGKSTFLGTLTEILGDYAVTSPVDTFTASNGERHPTELAMLRGARLVQSQETEEGRRWAESKLKALTGGDPIAARFMRGDFFRFRPEFKLIIAGNHRPHLRSVDEAIRRRFHMVPFAQRISDARRDEELPEKLRREWPGILQWAVDGCQWWLEVGLRPPESVRAETEQYLEAEDSFAAWLEETCDVRSTYSATAADLFASWSAWAERAGEHPGSMKRFSQNLQNRGFAPFRSGHGNVRSFRGLTLQLPGLRRVNDVA
jgi:putative DNA primase/helicase